MTELESKLLNERKDIKTMVFPFRYACPEFLRREAKAILDKADKRLAEIEMELSKIRENQ